MKSAWMERRTAADYQSMPWKNGAGVTTEIERYPSHGPFEWRVSIADVPSDGPFSLFPGIERIILVLKGTGMRLTHGAASAEVRHLQSHRFSGDEPTHCSLLDGPIRDFNVMARRDLFNARLSVHSAGSSPVQLQASLLYVVEGEVVVQGAGGELELGEGESALSAEGKPEALLLSGAGVVLAVSLERLSGDGAG